MSNVTRHVLSEEVLDKTMRLFWERGYFNTSIGDLIEVTGFNRAALYKHFGGKHGLFIAMLQRFRDKVVVQATVPVSDPSKGIDGIREFFSQFVEPDGKMMTSHGCFLISTASNLPSHDPEVAVVIEEFIDHLRSMFVKSLRYMQAEEQLNAEVDIEVVTDFLVGNVIGLMTLFRAAADNRMVENHIKGVIGFLSSLPVRKQPARGNLHLIN